MSQPAGRILLVEDEEALAESIRYSLDREGYAVTVAPDGRRAIERFHDTDPELVILDLMLPGALRASTSCGMIRQESMVPIIIVTAKDSEADKVTGLELGADDYVTKPFSVRELVSRVRAHLRRARHARPTRPTTTSWRAGRSRWTWTGTRSRVGARRSRSRRRSSSSSRPSCVRRGRLLTRELLIERDLGRRLRRRHEDARRPREAGPPEDRAGPARARAPPHGARARLQVRRVAGRHPSG